MPHWDPDWLNKMYNNRALVPEFGAHLARWQAASVMALQRAHADLAYGCDPSETLDVYSAQSLAPDQSAGEPAPVMVFVHGGYWRSLDKRDQSFLAPAFTRQGVCVVVPNYALCPAVSVPDITLQMVQAVVWVYRHIHAYGGDPQRIHVVGHSAGGQLAAMLLLCNWAQVAPDLPKRLVRSAVSLSGVFDLEPLRHTPFLQADLRLSDDDVARASPARLPAPPRGVLRALVGGLESAEFLRQNRLIREAWGPRRVPVCSALKGLNHFSILDAVADPQHRLHQRLLKWLRE